MLTTQTDTKRQFLFYSFAAELDIFDISQLNARRNCKNVTVLL